MNKDLFYLAEDDRVFRTDQSPRPVPEIAAGNGVAVRAVRFTELRDRAQSLWSAAGMGTLPEFSAGPIVSGTRSIKTSDPLDLRKWLEQYETSGYGSSHRARAFYMYDEFDGLAQFGRGRRTGMWDASGHAKSYYDKLGRAYREERWMDGRLFGTQQFFDAEYCGH